MHNGFGIIWNKLIIMGCAGIGIDRNVKFPSKMLDSQDVLNRKRQILVEYALRNKIESIILTVNSRVPFEIVKDLAISSQCPS
jgi:hypothetical protein